MSDAVASFRATAEAAQAAAGIIAARHRGDLASTEALLAGMGDRERAAGFLFLADLAIGLLARAEDRPAGEVAAELGLQIAVQVSGY